MKEKKGFSINGYSVFLALLIIIGAVVSQVINYNVGVLSFVGIVFIIFILPGFFMVQPNQGKVMTFFGSYVGTVKSNGLRWSIPFFKRKNISLRVRNFESNQMKVNDNHGNPIEIATVVVWSVGDTAEAMFEVDDYISFVNIQSESALRNMATSYPYDQHDGDEIALRSHSKEVSEALKCEIQERLEKAGVKVHEARISHLAYAPEIANAMLQRQQASAIIAARRLIVDGAVGMVEMALTQLSEKSIVELDEERKAAMVSNLLVVLCSDKSTQPVVNTGSLY
ncbi:SPFH domain-containing protein [Colwellia sp. 4_MG-2023]|jgi:regulator of protease activity HflC (stomatin/prohibitin superfamily)|uniref:SPFH domain-containing protein n=1 Tax=unclassified Colwellia TaxID=196834 RepID=UPI001C0A4758|nr:MULTISPECIES: SPFH domain-containing protein [unclassified Colwellia]MBU2924555.1 SPFH domain-containing protein [Colwellia sp. C2M11]MDO6508359.1 SPFH domain-containing protein [Colwellia sp. 5_MG-2023]MDO6556995.1 SPFH domain-containing protein [Colwellia sp. 4_MG-2023]MDO6653970.1 SPFH domain-containing protein [Colwellia sp. 3_MG-2023]MDO6666777.1 SPFH domain-containing protein [Colwellia sp. 2_MG-2023]